jgi:hypothetical protein
LISWASLSVKDSLLFSLKGTAFESWIEKPWYLSTEFESTTLWVGVIILGFVLFLFNCALTAIQFYFVEKISGNKNLLP